MNNEPRTATAPLSHADRLARFSAATPTTTMPDRPTDTSRNGMRSARRNTRRRIIR